jgi:hypothetical protein
MPSDYKRWLAIGAGAGIEIDGADLDVTIVRVRPSGVKILGALRLERFADRPAAEWGAEYMKFLRQAGAAHLAATVLLPRSEVIVRHLAMPGVSVRDLPQAISFQLDGLHPFNEDEAVYAWARLDSRGNVLVGITRREVVNRYISLFAEAGIKVASFTFSAAAIYASLRLVSQPPARNFLATFSDGAEMEAYGESDARPVFSASFDTPNDQFAERARSLAASELRLPPDSPVLPLDEALPKPKGMPEGFHLARRVLAYATAMVSACPRLSPSLNLLPPESRTNTSRLLYVPSIVLGALLLIGAGGLVGYSSYEDRQYLAKLQKEIQRLEPESRKPMLMDREIERARARMLMLDQFRKRTLADLDVLNELTRILEPPAWVNAAEITRDSIRITGEAPEAAGLLKTIDQSPLFVGSEFAAPMSRSANGEVFSIRARREPGK